MTGCTIHLMQTKLLLHPVKDLGQATGEIPLLFRRSTVDSLQIFFEVFCEIALAVTRLMYQLRCFPEEHGLKIVDFFIGRKHNPLLFFNVN